MAKRPPRLVDDKFVPFPSIRCPGCARIDCHDCSDLNAQRDQRFQKPRVFRDPAMEFADIMIMPIKPFFLLLEIWQNFLCGR